MTLDTGTACPPRLMRTNIRPTFRFASSVEIKRTFVEYPAALAWSSSCVSTRMSSTAKERRSSRNGCCWCLRREQGWVTQLLRQGDAKVFKKYSQMKLQMKREALEKMNRQANEMPLDSGTATIQ